MFNQVRRSLGTTYPGSCTGDTSRRPIPKSVLKDQGVYHNSFSVFTQGMHFFFLIWGRSESSSFRVWGNQRGNNEHERVGGKGNSTICKEISLNSPGGVTLPGQLSKASPPAGELGPGEVQLSSTHGSSGARQGEGLGV